MVSQTNLGAIWEGATGGCDYEKAQVMGLPATLATTCGVVWGVRSFTDVAQVITEEEKWLSEEKWLFSLDPKNKQH